MDRFIIYTTIIFLAVHNISDNFTRINPIFKPTRSITTKPCPFRSDASAIVLLKPVICLGHPVIRNKNNKAGEQKEEIRTFYTDVSSILFTYNENDLFSSRGRKEDREKEKKRNGLSAL